MDFLMNILMDQYRFKLFMTIGTISMEISVVNMPTKADKWTVGDMTNSTELTINTINMILSGLVLLLQLFDPILYFLQFSQRSCCVRTHWNP